MVRYIIKRLIETIPLFIVISIFIFAFIRIIPGDSARLLAGPDATIEEINEIKEAHGLNRPFVVQYLEFITGFFKGDFGTSITHNRPVAEILLPRYMPSIILAMLSIIWAFLIGVTIGVIAAVFRGKWPDYVSILLALTGISIPSFWLGLILIRQLAVKHDFFPVGGIDSFRSYILPSLTLGVGIMAMLARFSRSEMLEVLKNDYVRTARAKGLSEVEVLIKHGLKNSMVSIITIVGLQFGFLLGGSIIVETVFTIPGLGRLLIDSIEKRNYPIIQAELLIFSFQFVLVNFVVDIIYGFLNPKIRYLN